MMTKRTRSHKFHKEDIAIATGSQTGPRLNTIISALAELSI